MKRRANLAVVTTGTRVTAKTFTSEDLAEISVKRHFSHLIAKYLKRLPPEADAIALVSNLSIIVPAVLHMVLKVTKHLSSKEARAYLRYTERVTPTLITELVAELKEKNEQAKTNGTEA